MLSAPPKALISCFADYTRMPLSEIRIAGSPVLELPLIPVGNRRIVLVGTDRSMMLSDVAAQLRKQRPDALDDHTVYEWIFAAAGASDVEEAVVERGVRVVSLHEAIAQLIGLTPGWRDVQQAVLQETLEPVRVGTGYRPAKLYAIGDGARHDAVEWLKGQLGPSWNESPARIVYVRAEAGKGKSTLLASAVRAQLQSGGGPLPLLVPLRTLERGAGISWLDIATRAGAAGGSAAAQLASAIRTGLVSLALDGLDEVAGRYDPSLVAAVLEVVLAQTGPSSRIVLSGRTTEASLLDRSRVREVGIELPDVEDEAFTDYAKLVVDVVTPQWPVLAARVPEPPIPVGPTDAPAPTPAQREAILEWIELTFADLGKDRSLFFVQSLACIARSYQIVGNRALTLPGAPGMPPTVAPAALYDVCVLAAALACVREQDKVADIAHNVFLPAVQLDVLTWFALSASTEAALRSELPDPRQLAATAFKVDPVRQNEEFTEIVRQLQKHALLFSGGSEGLRAGDWRPSFLSDWVRSALICRAWERRSEISVLGGSPELIANVVANAQRSLPAFRSIFPRLAIDGKLPDLEQLVAVLADAAERHSPEASANYWALVTGADAESRAVLAAHPVAIAEMADLSGLTFEGLELGKEFSANVGVLSGCVFDGCTLHDVVLTSCDLSGTTFTGCTLLGVRIVGCDGPMRFEDCSFEDCQFIDVQCRQLPGYVFVDSQFMGTTRIIQSRASAPSGTQYGAICEFYGDNTAAMDPNDLVQGDWIGVDRQRLKATVARETVKESADPVAATLRALLKPFFPRRAGENGQRQARRYIRTSAVGRGVLPESAPNASELVDVLMAFGFTTGGREAHIYGPWSGVVGGGEAAVNLRNELLSYLDAGIRGPTVEQMLTRLRRMMGK